MYHDKSGFNSLVGFIAHQHNKEIWSTCVWKINIDNVWLFPRIKDEQNMEVNKPDMLFLDVKVHGIVTNYSLARLFRLTEVCKP